MRALRLSAMILFFVPLFAFGGKDPSAYPLKVHILQQNWSSHNVAHSEYKATGRGNIWEGNSIHAFDFTYDCSFGLTRTARNQPYLAKWAKSQLRLTLLAVQIGKPGKYHECNLKTTVHDGVYVTGGGGITEMSQQDFKAWREKRDASAASPQTDGTIASAVSKLSVASTPDSAEIEIDGEFMGNTPSVLELDPGEHSVSVRKAGYKTWEKKLKLTGGEIKLNAELESDASK